MQCDNERVVVRECIWDYRCAVRVCAAHDFRFLHFPLHKIVIHMLVVIRLVWGLYSRQAANIGWLDSMHKTIKSKCRYDAALLFNALTSLSSKDTYCYVYT